MSAAACVLCNHSTNDALQLGEKITYEDTTAHLYCLLLTSNLMQRGDDDEGLIGFMPSDIRTEVQRTKKLFCFYCREKGATIGCCVKSCRRSFHLPCALENDCRMEFTNTFRSYCDVHHNIKTPKNVHKPTDLCTVCFDEMGEYNPIRSIPLPCCNKNAWCHKICLQKYAQSSGYFLKCPLCNDSTQFRDWISQRGVFIPDRDAKWEVDGSGPNAFYDFEQHTERPSECVAKVCNCSRGRKYQVESETSKYSLVYCYYCGSCCAHLGCLQGNEFLCNECESIVNRNKANVAMGSTTDESDREAFRPVDRRPPNHQTNRSIGRQNRYSRGRHSQRRAIELNSDTNESFGKYSIPNEDLRTKFKLRDFTIRLRRLTPKDFGLQSESNESECEIASTSMSVSSRTSTKYESSSGDEGEVSIFRKNNSLVINNNNNNNDENSVDAKSCGNMNCENADMDNLSGRFTDGLRERQLSSSDDDKIRPTGAGIRKFLGFESSDDQTFGKENEQPTKSIAIVKPFSRNESSSDESIKPAKIRPRPRQRISSSDETSDDFLVPFVLPENKTFKTKEVGTKIDPNDSTTTTSESESASSPKKRKRRTVLSYFRDASSSDDEIIEQKPKRKSPKTSKQRLSTNSERSPSQSTIMHFFTRQLNHNI